MPKAVQRDEEYMKGKDPEINGKFFVGPLERGYGHTLGNALRRVMLSSLQGAAVTAVKIKGVQHEYSTIPGVVEDVAHIILNLKNLRLKLDADESAVLRLSVQGEGEVKAGDIDENPDVSILNKDMHIATIGSDSKGLEMELYVNAGRGWVSSDKNKKDDMPIGVIPLDSYFSPIKKANFNVESDRLGENTDFEKLIVEIETDGSINPEDSLAYAAKLLINHFSIFVNFEGELAEEEDKKVDEEKLRIKKLLDMRVDELELSVRSSNCLRLANIHTIRDLVRNQEQDMLKYKNFGRKSLIELTNILNNMGLGFGMDVSQYDDLDED